MQSISPIASEISKEMFRAYDIRGIVPTPLSSEAAFLIGRAIGTEVRRLGQTSLILGRDGRLSGPQLFKDFAGGVLETGVDVIDIGQVPTPLMYFATYHLNIPSGVIITGSHNPVDYNGFKIVLDYKALWGESIQALYHLARSKQFFEGAESPGKLIQQDVTEAYLNYIAQSLQLSRPLKIVVDSGNGVTGNIAPLLYERLGAKIIPLFCDIDGHFPNHHPDPGQPKNLQDLQAAVLEHQADLGLAFDGDGDRLGVVDNMGNIIWPDRILILYALDILKRHPKSSILYDVKCSRHVAAEIEKAQGYPLMCQTGHSLIKAKMQETGALLGGEMSGHFFFKERWFGFDDALYAGARLLELFSQQDSKITSHAWFATLPDSQNTPELQIKISEEDKFLRVQQLVQLARFEDAKMTTIDGLRVDFEDGFGLVRPSNTSACLVLRFEGDTKQALERIKDQFRSLLLSVDPHQTLPF